MDWEHKIKTDIASKVSAYAQRMIKDLRKHTRICLFGAGEHGKNWIRILTDCGINIDDVCDNNPALWGTEICAGVMCCSPDDIRAFRQEAAVIIAVRNYQDILKQLQDMGFANIYIASTNTIGFSVNYALANDNIRIGELLCRCLETMQLYEDELSKQICYETLYQWLVDENSAITYCGAPYFIPELEKCREEVFVDVGAYTGDTLEEFLKIYQDDFAQVYAFELDHANFKVLEKKVMSLAMPLAGKIQLFQKGLWHTRETLHYSSNCQTSQIAKDGEWQAEVVPLDEILGGQSVSFIKMDIEGAERNALQGCRAHIAQYRPKLAISVYHSCRDFYDIPKLMKELNPDYKLILRHHSTDESDTVCYAYEC